MASLESLTEDLLVRIYKGLASDADRKSWRLACRDFHRIDALARSSLRVLRAEYLHSLLANYPRLHTLDLSVCPRIDDAAVSVLLSGSAPSVFPRAPSLLPPPRSRDPLGWARGLRKLVLSRSTGLGHCGLEQVIRACAYLESVDVSHCCGFGDREAAALSCGERLREVKMDKCLGVTDVGLAKIAVGCGRLEKVSLKWCMEITDLGVDLLCKKCVGLKFLDLSYLKVTNDSLRSIGSLPKLEVLALVGCSLIDNTGLQFLGNGCPLLRVIDMSRCNGISSSGLVSVVKGHENLVQLNASYSLTECSSSLLHCFKDLKNLKAIKIDGARVSDSAFKALSNCTSLVEIGLGKCIGATNLGLMRLVSGFVNLRVLDLTCCHSITDAAIFAISDSCRNLTCLKLESCNMITEKSLYYLGSFCLLLEELDLTDCGGINDTGLEYLSNCLELSCLKLALCPTISDKGLGHIASKCRKICEIDLYRCTGIGDDALAALSSGFKKLRRLNLSYCPDVTDRGMKYLGQLEELWDLEMRGLVNVTGVGLTALAAGCKRLADLDMKYCENVDDSGFWALAYYARNLRQINLSHCNISNMGLCMVMSNLTRLQEAKLVHLNKVTVEGFELALRTCWVRIKKVKLLAALRFKLSFDVRETLRARGCKIRWD
ncbi:F-box/LRR-repeat protein 3 [Syzygium oleosum]|uniref:F-box/LRR-repeat protein 3 n=1 Tax=Syzygium oleosum TaxID=219896 RepID=UPI0024B9C1D9|nr:F-box/LRR-repeat protein 3 [Syzygium oleosum]